MRRLWRPAAAVSSGLLLVGAFPPSSNGQSAWVALVPLLILAHYTSPLQSFRWGFVGGLVFWLGSLVWLLRIGATGTTLPAAVSAWLVLSVCCALYMGMFLTASSALFSCVRRSGPADKTAPCDTTYALRAARVAHGVGLLVAVPLVWVGFEYLRSTLFTGFPWNALGVSQFQNLAVIQLAEWGGVYAVSALIVVLNTAITMMALRLVEVYGRRRPGRFQIELACGFLICLVLWLHGVRTVRQRAGSRTETTTVRVATVQPNIEQRKKWRAEDAYEIFAALEEQTDFALASRDFLDLIIWPETAVPGPINADPESGAFVRDLAREGVPLLVGSMEVLPGKENASNWREASDRYYNSSFLIGTNGEVVACYRKQHLVPFGEYIPLDKYVKFIHDIAPLGFTCTPGTTSTVFDLPNARFSALICFEDTVAGLARRAVRDGARFLALQTNDAWYDPWAGSLQHMSHCVFRSVENRVPIVRVGNTGVSCAISSLGRIEAMGVAEDPWGRSIRAMKPFELKVEGAEMPLTFYTRYGDLPFALPCGVLSLAGFLLVVMTERRKNTGVDS